MDSPQYDFIVSPETNQTSLPSDPLAVVPQHGTANNSSLSNNASPSAESPPTFHNLELGYFADYPLSTVDNFTEIMEICLANNNPEAHYVEGLKEYFHFRNTSKGLDHLRRAAAGNYDNATYIYAVLKLSTGDHAEGKQYMATLGWKDNKSRVDRCWRRVKRSLREFEDIKRRKRYNRNMMLLKPAKRCHINDMDNRCKRCFYYKQILKFIDYI